MNRKNGFTLLEVIIGVAMLSMLLAAGNSVLSYSRMQTEKGFWIQQAIAQLRNTTRFIGNKMKETSYPSTLVSTFKDGKEVDLIYSFKELREYDTVGRLRMLRINDSDVYNMHTIDTKGDSVTPTADDLSIMYFPISKPEVIKNGNKVPGTGIVTWVHIVLRPGPAYDVSGLGVIHVEETDVPYSTRPDDYAFALGKPGEAFNPKSAEPNRKRPLITDVQSVRVDTFSVDEEKGFYVTQAGVKSEMSSVKRNLVSLTINCCHPKDGKINLSDQCSVITRVEQSGSLPTPPSIQLISVSPSKETVRVRYKGQTVDKQKFDWVGEGSQIVEIYATAIRVKEGNRERLIVASDD